MDDIEATAMFLMDLATGYYHRVIEVEPERLGDSTLVDQLDNVLCRYLIGDE